MKVVRAEEIYQLLDQFIETCIFNDDSLVTTESDIFTLDAINEVFEHFVLSQIPGDSDFETKIKQQFKDVSSEGKLVMAHAIWLWCMSASDFKKQTKRHSSTFILDNEPEINEDAFLSNGFGSAGPFLKYNKPNEIIFCVLVIKALKEIFQDNKSPDVSYAKEWIENICLKAMYDEDIQGYNFSSAIVDNIPKRSLAMSNILLHLSNPEKYERIASENHKNNIYYTFQGLLDDANEVTLNSNREVKIKYIRDQITSCRDGKSFDFYENEFQEIWNYNLGEDEYNEFQALLYKKAVILYGPPGTSKTFTAKWLAETLIYQHYFKDRENVKAYFKEKPDITSERIHRLQLHPNYSYEDFIAGIQIIDGETKAVEGDFLTLIKAVSKDEFPHVLILDEINRIDLSSLFGELFSALENRNDEINLSIGGFKISVPDNLYVIGTMNEIDFSLERLDFALRRRFVWFFYGYNEESLRQIMNSKIHEMSVNIYDKDIEDFIDNVSELNRNIANSDELGKSYEIGHTFFAEIIDIYQSFKEIKGRTRKFNMFMHNGPVEVLWSISIMPILNAFMGNMDADTRKENLEKYRNIYLGNV